MFSFGQQKLEDVLKDAVRYLKEDKKIPQGEQVVILSFGSDFPKLSEYIVIELTDLIVNDGYLKLIERQQLEAVRKERESQLSFYIADSEQASLGKELGARFVISGEIKQQGNNYQMRIWAIDVDTAQRVRSKSWTVRNSSTIADLTKEKNTVPERKPVAKTTRPVSLDNAINKNIIDDLGKAIAEKRFQKGSAVVFEFNSDFPVFIVDKLRSSITSSRLLEVIKNGNAPISISGKIVPHEKNATYLLTIEVIDKNSGRTLEIMEYTITKNDQIAAALSNTASQQETYQESSSSSSSTSSSNTTWNNNKIIYLGARAGYSNNTYSLPTELGEPSVGGHTMDDFDWANLDYGGYLAVQFGRFVALQVECNYINDLVSVDSGSGFDELYKSTSLMIPALLKLTWRPAIFLFQGYGGAYYALPLGDITVGPSPSQKWEIVPSTGSMGWLAGGSAGFCFDGFGLYFDIRVGDSFGYMQAYNGSEVADVYKRFFVSYSIGVEFGLFNQKKR